MFPQLIIAGHCMCVLINEGSLAPMKWLAAVDFPADHPDYGIRSAHLRDPDGNLIEIYSQLPKTRWSRQLGEDDEVSVKRWPAADGKIRLWCPGPFMLQILRVAEPLSFTEKVNKWRIKR